MPSDVAECGISLIAMNVVELREVDPPQGVAPLHWVLWTSHAVTSFKGVWTVIEHFEKRPLIKEFHKGLKAACRLLQRKSVARAQPDRPAKEDVLKG